MVIIMLAAGWSALWFWAADKLDVTLDQRIERLAVAGIKVGCEARAVTGYPFRLGVRCERVSGSSENGIIEAGELRSAAQLYAPGKMILELDAPMTVEPVHGAPLQLEWELARASSLVRLVALPDTDVERLSVEFRQPRLKDGWRSTAPALATAQSALFHYRPTPGSADDIDLAMDARQLVVESTRLPAMTAKLSASIKAIRPLLAPEFELPRHIAENGLAGMLHYLRMGAETDETGQTMKLSGPFEIDRAGFVSGRVKLVLSDIEAARPFARSLLGGQERAVDDLLKIIALLPSDASDGQQRSVVLRIDKGVVSAGLFELGRIPPLI